jgi:hypothetical protein
MQFSLCVDLLVSCSNGEPADVVLEIIIIVITFPCVGGWLEYRHLSPASRRRRRKGNPVTWGDINTGTWFSRLEVGCKADDLAL